jgi:hypothetical protein
MSRCEEMHYSELLVVHPTRAASWGCSALSRACWAQEMWAWKFKEITTLYIVYNFSLLELGSYWSSLRPWSPRNSKCYYCSYDVFVPQPAPRATRWHVP